MHKVEIYRCDSCGEKLRRPRGSTSLPEGWHHFGFELSLCPRCSGPGVRGSILGIVNRFGVAHALIGSAEELELRDGAVASPRLACAPSKVIRLVGCPVLPADELPHVAVGLPLFCARRPCKDHFFDLYEKATGRKVDEASLRKWGKDALDL